MVWSRDGDGDVTFPAREGMSVDGLKARVRCEPVGTTLVVDWDMAWCRDDVKANGCEMVREAEVCVVNQMARRFLHTYLTIILSYHSDLTPWHWPCLYRTIVSTSSHTIHL
jgi:hypothetical protein